MNLKSYKKLKITGLLVLVLFLGIIIWANIEPKGFAQANINDTAIYETFAVTDATDSISATTFEKKISKIKGVSTCSYNGKDKIAGIIYYTSMIDSEELQSQIKNSVGVTITKKSIAPAKGGCPVGGITYRMKAFKDFFKIRS